MELRDIEVAISVTWHLAPGAGVAKTPARGSAAWSSRGERERLF